jgi:hypothetical protein
VVDGGEEEVDEVRDFSARSKAWSATTMVYCRGGERRLEWLQASVLR